MANRQIIDYIKRQLQTGVAKDLIKTALLDSGWSEADITDAFAALAAQAVVAAPPTTVQMPKPGTSGTVVTSDIYQPTGPDGTPLAAVAEVVPVLVQEKQTKKEIANAKIVEAIFQPGGQAMPEKPTVGKLKTILKIGFMVVGVLLAGFGGYVIYSLMGDRTDLASRTSSLEDQVGKLTPQIATLAKEKEDLAARIATLLEDNASLVNDLALFMIPDGAKANATGTVTVKGILHGGGAPLYTLVTKSGITVTIKNSKDQKVDALLKPLVGAAQPLQLLGEHVLGSRDITVQMVSSTVVQ